MCNTLCAPKVQNKSFMFVNKGSRISVFENSKLLHNPLHFLIEYLLINAAYFVFFAAFRYTILSITKNFSATVAKMFNLLILNNIYTICAILIYSLKPNKLSKSSVVSYSWHFFKLRIYFNEDEN